MERFTHERIVDELSAPGMYAQPVERVQVVETHVSHLFLAGDRAYKLKKPIRMTFLDYRAPEQRRTMCELEVKLNRRLAPDIYLGVRAVVPDHDRLVLGEIDDPAAIDYLVEMRRFDEENTLAARAAHGDVTATEVEQIGRVLTAFHARAERIQPTFGAGCTERRRFDQNVLELLQLVDDPAGRDLLLDLTRFVGAFVARHGAEMHARAESGHYRDGHGDLRAEHLVIADGIQVIDCVEFDPALRALDVGDDLAFLMMDLHARGRSALADQLVAAYRAAGGDPGTDELIAFFAVNHALVRAKVALLRARQDDADADEQQCSTANAVSLMGLARRFCWRARTPLALIVCGLPASGKSNMAALLATASGLPIVASDPTRKRLAGLAPSDRGPQWLYTPEFDLETYAALGEAAAAKIAGGSGGVIIDGTFRRRRDRDAFRRALPSGLTTIYVQCIVPSAVLKARAAGREREHDRESDADLDVVSREMSSWEALDEISPLRHLPVRGDLDPSALLDEVAAWLDRVALAR